MPYLNLDVDFFSHRKTVRLISRLGTDAPLCLLRLWSYVAKHHCELGMLQAYQDCELEAFMEWHGESGKILPALVEINFLDKIDSGYAIHDWHEHSAHLIAFKKRGKTAAKARWNKYATSIAKMKSSIAKDEICNAPNQTKLSQTKLSKAPSISFPNDGEWLEGLKQNPAYRYIDFTIQLGKMDAWLALPQNAKRKKTRQFVLNWLNRIDTPLPVERKSIRIPV